MTQQWQYQVRIYLADQYADLARRTQESSAIKPLTDILAKHQAWRVEVVGPSGEKRIYRCELIRALAKTRKGANLTQLGLGQERTGGVALNVGLALRLPLPRRSELIDLQLAQREPSNLGGGAHRVPLDDRRVGAGREAPVFLGAGLLGLLEQLLGGFGRRGVDRSDRRLG